MSGKPEEMRSLALTPTWSVATVLTIFVFVSLLVERSIHRLSSWLKKTHRNPLFEALEKMKEELMLLGFISLLLTATSRTISSICIDSKFYNSKFSPCTRSEVDDSVESDSGSPPERKQLMGYLFRHSLKRLLSESTHGTCTEGHEPFVSYEGLEQLHRFIFVMAITHVSYSCLTMLLAIVKIHTWRSWEDEAQRDQFDAYCDITTRALTMRRQSTFVKFHAPHSWSRNCVVVWVICFFRQFGRSVARADYLTLRRGFIMNHNLTSRYDFHSYMIRSMEEEFEKIVGVSAPLWGFVIAFMLFNINGSNLYFWIAIIPITLVLLVGAKLQHVIATLALESAGISGLLNGGRLKPRDGLFWFKKPELLLNLIHFILFQNSFELASFFWFWVFFSLPQLKTILALHLLFNFLCFFSGNSDTTLAISETIFSYIFGLFWGIHKFNAMQFNSIQFLNLIFFKSNSNEHTDEKSFRFAGQFLCSYSTLPLYALVTQMGSNYKAALIPQRIRETIHGWGKAAKKRRRHRRSVDESTIRTETSTVCSIEEDEQLLDDHYNHSFIQIELQPNANIDSADNDQHSPAADESTIYSTNSNTPLLHCSFSVPTSPSLSDSRGNGISRSASMPIWRS